jgi:hypothetical protein
MTKKIKVTITYEYDANPVNYGTNDPVEMAKIDQENWDMYHDFCMDMLLEKKYRMTVSVEPAG